VCAQVTTDLDAEPFNGDWLKVVKEPLGWIALGAQLGAILLQYLFGKWSQHATALRTAQVCDSPASYSRLAGSPLSKRPLGGAGWAGWWCQRCRPPT
jgi:hypothetical protein